MKIGLISDVHATLAPVLEAFAQFEAAGVEMILCAGDIAGYGKQLEETVEALCNRQCRMVIGNHDLWLLERGRYDRDSATAEQLRNLSRVMEFKAAGRTIYMVHASPPDSLMAGIKLLDDNALLIREQKQYWASSFKDFTSDILVVGHTHQVFAERLGKVLVINPGSTLFNHTCAILTLPEMAVQIIPLGGKRPVLSWNWGMIAVDRGLQ